MELQAQQAQATASSATTPPSRNKDAKSPELPSFIDEKDELDSYLLCFEHYAENASWEKDTWAIKLSALLTGRAMDVYTRMSDTDANDYDKLKKALLTRYNNTEDGSRKRLREIKPETEETPNQFVIHLKNYLAKWLELSGSFGDFEAIVDLIVTEQFINACSEELAVYLLDRGPKDLVELTTWAQQYLIAHKQQLGGKTKSTVQPKRAEQRRQTQSKLDTTQGRQRSLQCYRCQGYGHRQTECPTKASPSNDQKSLTPVGQSNQKKTCAMVARSSEDGEEAFTCMNVEKPRSSGNSKKSNSNKSTSEDEAIYSAACRAQSNDGQIYIEVGKLNGRPVKILRDTGCTGMVVDRALIPDSMVIPSSSGSLQVIDHTMINVQLANVYLDPPYYKGHCKVMCVSLPVYPVIIGNVKGARQMLPNPNWKARQDNVYSPPRNEYKNTNTISKDKKNKQ